eukprot:COSAG02_NODE_2311_length_9167_cov_20.835024_6_plen_114_part_00
MLEHTGSSTKKPWIGVKYRRSVNDIDFVPVTPSISYARCHKQVFLNDGSADRTTQVRGCATVVGANRVDIPGLLRRDSHALCQSGLMPGVMTQTAQVEGLGPGALRLTKAAKQ